jgi:glycosyltransferase involved in cell wall biosynthesis
MWNCARMLSAHGHRVVFVTDAAFSPQAADWPGEVEVLGIEPRRSPRSLLWSLGKRLPGGRLFRAVTAADIEVVKFAGAVAAALPGIVSSRQIDLVFFSESFMEYLYCLPVKDCRSIVRFDCPRYLFQEIGLSDQPVNRYLAGRDNMAIRRFSAHMTPTNALANLAGKYYHLAANQITVIPNPVDTECFYPAAAEHGDNPLSLCFAGRFSREKGAEVIIEMLPRLMAEHPELRFSLAGDSGQDAHGQSYLDMLADKLTKIGASSRFFRQSSLPYHQMPEFYRRHDLLVSPTRFESFGMAIVEAQACGLPVVASAVGGVPEVMQDGVTGYLISGHDPEMFYHQLKRLITDNRLRAEMGRAATAFVREKFSFDAVYKKFRKMMPE